MQRVHLLEFEDLGWFPSWLRTCMTNNIVILARALGVANVLASLTRRVLKQQGIERLVDLGSGGGGVMPEVVARLRAQPDLAGVELTLTDLYPNDDAVKRYSRADAPTRYLPTPVDATALADAPPGLKTMCNCFHHMRPKAAHAILKSARDNRQPLLIYEMGPPMRLWVWALTLPLALPLVFTLALIQSAFVRPVTFNQLFFTYVVPLIPIFYAWDGHASAPRIYSMEDLDVLLADLHGPGYRWEKGPAQDDAGRTVGSYLLGLPEPNAPPD